jgi:radical SAM protein with 4Fe4S-binding SPASM domain
MSLIDAETEAALIAQPRPRTHLPIAPKAQASLRHLPLEAEVRAQDAVRPIYAVWEVTLQCDLGCRHCGSRAGKKRPDELTTAQCFDLIAQMADLGIKEVTLIGGEAYLRADFADLVREVRRQGMDCTMTSGGRGIDAALAQAAAVAGLQSVSISLDGDERIHDRLRGVDGSYRSALQAIKNLKAAGIHVSVNTQINRLSFPHMDHILDVLLAHGCHGWQLQMTVPMGRAVDEPEVLPQPYDLLEVFPKLAELQPRAEAGGVRIYPGNNVGYFGPYEAQLRKHVPQGHSGSCGAGRATLGLEADGTIKGCPSLHTTEWAGGNIQDTPLKDIWERSVKLRYTRDRTLDDLWGYCRTCYYAESCMSGCTWMTHSIFGKPGNNPYCHHRSLEMDRQGLRERIVLKQAAPGLPFDRGLFELVVEAKP